MTGQLPQGWTISTPQPAPQQTPLPGGWSITPPAQEAAPASPSMPVADMAKEAMQNTPSSAVEFAKNLVYPIMHPVETAGAMKDVALGVLQKVRNMSPPEQRGAMPPFDETAVNAVADHFAKRYGSAEGAKATFAKDPVGMAADVSALLTGGGTLAARGPSVIGTTGRIVSNAGRAVDPVSIATLPLKAVEPVVSNIIGQTTGAGSAALREAYKAGRTGGPAAESFVDQMRGNAPAGDVVESAKAAVNNLREQRSSAYKEGMSGVTGDPTVLDFQPIRDALDSVKSVGTYKGKTINPSTSATWDKINALVEDWQKSDPAQFHTVEGLDALKKAIGDVRDSTEFGSPSRRVADQAYQSVRTQITNQAPAYGKVMKDYEAASEALREIEKAFSLGEKSTIDSAVRKFQSIMRNNANTNYGQRAELGKTIQDAGAETLFPQIAGQALNSPTPRGIHAASATAGGLIAALMNPLYLGALPLTSPRLMGEGAFALGKAAAGPGSTPTARAVGEFLDPNLARLIAYQTGQQSSSDPLVRALRPN